MGIEDGDQLDAAGFDGIGWNVLPGDDAVELFPVLGAGVHGQAEDETVEGETDLGSELSAHAGGGGDLADFPRD